MSKTSEREHMLHERLKAAYARDVVTFYTNFDKLHAPASPIFDPWLAVGPFLGLLLLAVTVLFLGGLIAGTLAMIIAVVVYVMMLRPWMETQFRDRAIAMALKDLKSFQTLWDYGGIGMAMTDRPETIIAAPEGHWRNFITRHMPNIETEVLDAEMQTFVPSEIPDRRLFDLNTVVVPPHGTEDKITMAGHRITRRRGETTIIPPDGSTPVDDLDPPFGPTTGDETPHPPQDWTQDWSQDWEDPATGQAFPPWDPRHKQEK